jgi:Caspase domain
MAANPDDHALVIGIGRYADVAAAWISDLQGPVNDAMGMAAWLREEGGGGLPAGNVREVLSPNPFDPGTAEPHQTMIMTALNDIAQLAKGAYKGQYAGRRLYVYVSGHGWANRRNEAAVVTAEATLAQPLNVLVTSWVDWMLLAAPFEELVFWGDTCATRVPLTKLFPCTLGESFSGNSPTVRSFSAYAAPVGLVAVENHMPDGAWHGAFTYALMQGLRGAAQTPLTTDTLRDYLLNAQKEFLDDDQRRRATVAKEPSFGFTDVMAFGSPTRPRFPVSLRFQPGVVGRRVSVGVARSDPPVAATELQGTQWDLALEAGAYGVFVDGSDASDEFQVIGGGVDDVVDVDIT